MTEISELIKIKNIETKIEQITKFIKKEVFEIYQKKGVVIGLSGGIDSAITAALCTKSIGSEKVLGLILPEKESDPNSENLAQQIANKYNIKTKTIDITNILESFGVYENKEKIVKEKFSNYNEKCKYRVVVPPKLENNIGMPFLEILDNENVLHKLKISSFDFLNLTALTSIKHRVRMTMLYNYSEKNNFAVIGTTNKTEYLQGYFVKYGDGGSDIEPLVHLYKTQIYQIANFLKLPEKIINQDASPDVWSFKTSDEEFFYAVPYNIVDLILYAREKNLSINEIIKSSNLSSEKIEKLIQFQNQKQNKSQTMRENPHSIEEN
ncbi:NAD(+) synthase [Nitrosopumilus sp.]|jgi:NAD+ synthase|nr:NAD(+) synthase [Nitrosopumilus sp.]